MKDKIIVLTSPTKFHQIIYIIQDKAEVEHFSVPIIYLTETLLNKVEQYEVKNLEFVGIEDYNKVLAKKLVNKYGNTDLNISFKENK